MNKSSESGDQGVCIVLIVLPLKALGLKQKREWLQYCAFRVPYDKYTMVYPETLNIVKAYIGGLAVLESSSLLAYPFSGCPILPTTSLLLIYLLTARSLPTGV